MSNESIINFRVVLPAGALAHHHRPGDNLNGKVSLTVGKVLKAQRISLRFIGLETVHISPQADTPSLFATTRFEHELFNIMFPIWGYPENKSNGSPIKKKDWKEICIGTHDFSFEIKFPRINYPPTLARDGLCKIQYILQAQIERPGSLLNSSVSSNKEEILFEPMIFPTTLPRAISETSEESTNKWETKVGLDFECSKSEAQPGDVVCIKVEAKSPSTEYVIRSAIVQLVEVVEQRALIRGSEKSCSTTRYIDKWLLDPAKQFSNVPEKPKPERTRRVRSNNKPILQSFVHLKLPWELKPCQSPSVSISYEFHVSVRVSKVDDSILTNVKNFTLQTWPRATFCYPISVIHVDPQSISPDAFSNSYMNPAYNIENIRIPSYLEDGQLPTINFYDERQDYHNGDQKLPLDGDKKGYNGGSYVQPPPPRPSVSHIDSSNIISGAYKFTPWDESNPLWKEYMEKKQKSIISRASTSH
ncbi:hypothetical protein H4219_005133 [Mycoemilia scoparia]|uniref:Arrestin-like N-terminal domain-containing protein n=1 Tax=Mycoemilia scoparia TaxID=417184 RepID=A0A9W7ZUW5_9FUNG|nr:hypothetical protein H4219_005133 [Mycoemilia scoparia]